MPTVQSIVGNMGEPLEHFSGEDDGEEEDEEVIAADEAKDAGDEDRVTTETWRVIRDGEIQEVRVSSS